MNPSLSSSGISEESCNTFISSNNNFSKKFQSSILQDGFNVTALLDMLDDPIRELYESRINNRTEDEEEFDFDNIAIGRKPEDSTFYEKCFLPAAVLFTYQEIHHDYQGKDLWDDVFTLASGSKGYDLIPETNPICKDCASVYFPNLKNVNPSEILDLNVRVFKRQKENTFKRPSIVKYLKKMQSGTLFENNSSDDDLESEGDEQKIEILGKRHFNPFSEDGSDSMGVSGTMPKKVAFNPFSSDDSNSDEDGTQNSCTICKKSFSVVEYLHYHNRVFHDKSVKISNNKTKILVSKFVSDGEEMMTSFIAPDEVKENERKHVEKESTTKSRKFNLRERSRRKLDM